MVHPLLHLIATQPHLIGEHVEAYAQLVGEEVGKASTQWISRVVYWAAALALIVLAVLFAGIALMLWAGSPSDTSLEAPWLLIVVPLVPFVIGVICILLARAKATHRPFDTIRQQFSADVAMLRDVGAA